MNLAAYFSGSLKALGRGDGWETDFDLSKKGFSQSFAALFLTLPCYYVCGLAVAKQRAALTGAEIAATIPLLPFVIIFTLYAFAFSVCAYLIAMVFDKQDRFRAWVIVRHWTVFFAVLLAAVFMGLTLIGLPFVIANFAAFALYMSTLVIDIRYAQKIAGFEWGAAVLTGCILTAMGFTILLTGVAQFTQ